ncbi:transcriptional regulator, TetR family [Geomicrobium sp. JCM 19037]|uniref:TetR/AcrR family transcriptional regulator n=1 Tax=unclassified Geomicrobium TaxID=2628951 RepID=UPI00045F46F2|nr:TetR/AcrR family transcriptional regulator [Geomicrobium sp. JCM 19037]GAK05947.1 transcriptional regulator, TetR family [Geomicrobium sp. JCM 19037]
MSKKREQLLQQSEQLFSNQGFHAVGLKQLIKEADVSLMTLYNHFDSKESLILEILKRREKRYFESLNTASRSDDLSIPHAFTEAHLKWTRANKANGCMFLRAKEEYNSINDEVVAFVEQHKTHLFQLFHEHGLTKQEALRLVLLFEGATSSAEVFALSEVAEELRYSVQALFPNS